tara:strand:+ start:780 stop:887 length:108 start_codon:yes stop_codon:yes gene_type:complete
MIKEKYSGIKVLQLGVNDRNFIVQLNPKLMLKEVK